MKEFDEKEKNKEEFIAKERKSQKENIKKGEKESLGASYNFFQINLTHSMA